MFAFGIVAIFVLFLLGREDFMFSPHSLRGYNNYDLKIASDEAGTSAGDEPSLAQQHFRDECDINVIVERFGLLGQLPVDVRPPMYGDFTGVSDFRQALEMIRAAEDAFMQLPPKVRAQFDNDAELFVDFCQDPRNIDAMREMGLAVSKESGDGKEQRGGDVGVGASDRGEASASGSGRLGDWNAVGGSKGGVGAGAAGAGGAGAGGEGGRK